MVYRDKSLKQKASFTQTVTYTGRGIHAEKTTVDKFSDGEGFTKITKRKSMSNADKLKFSGSIFKIFVMLLLVFALYRTLIGASTITFRGFLEFLQSVPSVNIAHFSSVIPLLDTGSVVWGSFFRFLNYFINVFNVLIFVGVSLVQVLVFVTYFIGWLFVF